MEKHTQAGNDSLNLLPYNPHMCEKGHTHKGILEQSSSMQYCHSGGTITSPGCLVQRKSDWSKGDFSGFQTALLHHILMEAEHDYS